LGPVQDDAGWASQAAARRKIKRREGKREKGLRNADWQIKRKFMPPDAPEVVEKKKIEKKNGVGQTQGKEFGSYQHHRTIVHPNVLHGKRWGSKKSEREGSVLLLAIA